MKGTRSRGVSRRRDGRFDRRINVWAQVMPWNAGDAFDFQHALGRDSLPLTNGLAGNAQSSSELHGTPGSRDRFSNCIVHGGDKSISFTITQAARKDVFSLFKGGLSL